MARRGCLVRCIITPPSEMSLIPSKVDYACQRVTYLLNFLKGQDKALEKIEWTVSPFRQKNLYIVGHIACYESYKKGIQRGYGLTLRQTGNDAITSNISLYRALFERLMTYTLVNYGNPNTEGREALCQATMNCLEDSLKYCKSHLLYNNEGQDLRNGSQDLTDVVD